MEKTETVRGEAILSISPKQTANDHFVNAYREYFNTFSTNGFTDTVSKSRKTLVYSSNGCRKKALFNEFCRALILIELPTDAWCST